MKTFESQIARAAVLALSLGICVSIAGSATAASLTPPPQTLVLEFGPYSISAPSSPVFDLGSQYSIEFWILPAAGGPAVVFLKDLNPHVDPFVAYECFINADGTIQFSQSTGVPGSLKDVVSPLALPLRAWTHIAATSDGATLRLFVNGSEVAETPSPGSPPVLATPALRFGGLGSFALREMRIWNRALSATDIADVSSHSLSRQPGLMANWRFDEGATFVASDLGPFQLNLQFAAMSQFAIQGEPRPVHAAAIQNGPFFALDGPTSATSIAGTDHYFGQGGTVDYDHDGATDVIVTTSPLLSGRAVVLHNDGSGHFEDRSATAFSGPAPSPFSVTNVVSGDFNGDGRQDVFLADIGEGRDPYWGAQNLLLLQTATGTLSDVTSTSLPQANTYSYTARAADIDGSGHLDLYLGNIHYKLVADTHGPLFLDNDGTGHFQFNETRLPSDFLEPTDVGSLWGTGTFINARHHAVPDLVLCCPSDVVSPTSRDTLLLNDGTGHFTRSAAEAMPFSVPAFGTELMETADFDGDGWDDLIEYGCSTWGNPDFNDCRLRLLLNNQDGTFREAPSYDLPPISNPALKNFWAGDLRVSDFNGDGHVDILVNSNGPPPILLLNRGDGSFVDASEIIPISFFAGTQTFALDLDGNGSTDLFSASGQNFFVARQIKPVSSSFFVPVFPSGDANGDNSVSAEDVFYLIDFLFLGGTPPSAGDADGDGLVTTADIFYLISYLFAGGPPPR